MTRHQGRLLAQGTPRQVQAHPGVIAAYLGSMDDASALRRPPAGALDAAAASAAALT